MTDDTTTDPLANPVYDNLRAVLGRAKAERLRREAVELAVRYARLVERSGLDSEIVAVDRAAVIRAWRKT